MESEFFKRFIAQIEFLLITFGLPISLLMEGSLLPYRDLSSLEGFKPFLIMVLLFSIEVALWVVKEAKKQIKKEEIKHFNVIKDMFFMYSIFALMQVGLTMIQGELWIALFQMGMAMLILGKYLILKRASTSLI